MAKGSGNPVFILAAVALFIGQLVFVCCNDVITATCDIAKDSGTAPIYGTVKFTQSGGITTLEIGLKGFSQSTGTTLHGFHVHEFGDLGNRCDNAKGHYNPDGVDHAGPKDRPRHVGDLGNIAVGANGEANLSITDDVISLTGDRTIIGRAIVVHALDDDLGRGNYSDSKTTGHAGARLGCCTITATGLAILPSIFSITCAAAMAMYHLSIASWD